MTDTSFRVRNTLVVNSAFSVNSTGIYFGASPTLALNSTFYAGQSAFVNTAGNFNVSGNLTINAALVADNDSGSLGQVLMSANTYTYWQTLAASATTDTTNASNITTGAVNASLITTGTMSSSRISGLATSATTDTTNASNITSGTLPNARIVNLPTSAISGLATSATTDTTNASNITTGSMSNARVSGLAASATTDTTNGSNITTGTVVAARLPADVLYSDVTSQVITGGASVTSLSLTAGNITVNCGSRPLQYIASNSNYTITAPASDGSCILLLTNGTAVNTVTFSGFTVGSTGDSLDKVSGHKFMIYIVRINSISTYTIKALQ